LSWPNITKDVVIRAEEIFTSPWISYTCALLIDGIATLNRKLKRELVCRALKEKSLTGSARAMVNNIEGLQEVWDTLK
jgi:hypothetical protein